MTDRPILFSAPMVQAILDGRKTQTRRAVKPQPAGEIRRGEPDFNHWIDTKYWERQNQKENRGIGTRGFACPYGQPGGDRLYVRETWAAPHAYDHLPPRLIPQDARIHYAATEDRGGLLWRPSIHMPRWASRITLEITGVRVERLQDITIEDAKAEGAWGPDASIADKVAEHFGIDMFSTNPRNAFQMLWEQSNGPDSWAENPWAWVVEFKAIEAKP